ncbi:MAG: hypothetical protein KDK04_09890 [Candidatus Competibacteraceae bacterium]|nr:hypothetical protein [Candidatus Competibacteraceae bacterium]
MVSRYCKRTIARIGFMLLTVSTLGFGQDFDPAIVPRDNMDFDLDQQRVLEQLISRQELNRLDSPSGGIRYKNYMLPDGISENKQHVIRNLLDELERVCPTCAQVPGVVTGVNPYTLPALPPVGARSSPLASQDGCSVPSWLDAYIPVEYAGCRREYIKTKLE